MEEKNNIMNIYEQEIKDHINSIANSDVYSDHKRILDLPEDKSEKIICYLLSCACCGQNVHPIMIGREILVSLPKEWICKRIKDLVFKSINIYDDWDYRRFLELSKLISTELLEWAITISNNSQNPDIIEAAEDFKTIL